MKDPPDRPPDLSDLRRRAEAQIEAEAVLPDELSPAQAASLIHELRVHQIELEMQNDELRLAQARLEESRSKYADLYDFAPVGYLTLDRQDRIIEANLTAATHLGVERSKLMGRVFPLFLAQADRSVLRQLLNNGLNHQERRGEVRLKDGNGDVRVMLLDILFLRDAEGRERRRVSMTDITDLRRAQELARERTAELVQVNETLRATLDAVPAAIIDLDTEGRVKNLWNPAAEHMFGWRREEVVGRFMPTIPDESHEEFANIRAAVLSGKAIVGKDVVRRRKDGSRIEYSLYVAPEFDDQGRVNGIVGVLFDITERRLAERQAAQIAAIVQASDDAIISKTLDGVITSWNKGAEKIYGYRADEVVGRPISLLAPPEIEDEVPQILDRIKHGEQVKQYETLRRRKDGQDIYMSLAVSPIRDAAGKIVAASTIGRDITERWQAEEQLGNSERNLRTAIDTIPAYVFSALPDGSFDFASQNWFDYSGLSPEEVYGWDWTDVVHPEDRDRAVEKWCESMATGVPGENEHRVRQANGEYRWFLARNAALRDEKGHIVRWYVVLVDIEDRKRAEEQLRNSERNLRTTIETIPAYVFSALPDGSFDFFSKNWFDYSGLSPEEVYGLEWLKTVHPEDRSRAVEKWRESMATGVPGESEHRVRQANGEYRWFLARNAALRDEKGNIVRWYGVLIDIEEQKRAEARLRQALDEIQKLQEQLHRENIQLREEVDRTSMFEEIVGASPPLKALLARIDKVAPTDTVVLITGETGTGKELVARAIHKRSPRASRAFVSVNCAAIPASLIASELFGHEKGAFTGAHQRHLGRFELADGGTIFLDEIGELPMETQIALLRVLQDQEFQRLGGSQTIRAKARVITATNRDLQAAVAAGSFRSDLFYRLNVFPIEVPPLRERQEDIPILVEYFIHRYASKLGKKIRRVSKKTLDMLQSYSWPGNIRELQNVLERSTILCDSENFSVNESCLFRESRSAQPASQPLPDRLVSQAKEMIEAALAESGGRVSGPSGAAAKLGMRSSTLEAKIKSLKINKYLFKKPI